MKGLLVHGCYDTKTFRTLETLGVDYLGFDLRARSMNLITLKNLKEILPELRSREAVLVFENDSCETIHSYLDLLKDSGKSFLLEFRDKKSKDFYEGIAKPFIWHFSPDADWKEIISASNCEGIILPLKYQSLFQDLPHLWTLIDEYRLRIWLHAETFEECEFFHGKENIQGSIDLGVDLHVATRTIDQVLLKNLKFWRKVNECPAGQ